MTVKSFTVNAVLTLVMLIVDQLQKSFVVHVAIEQLAAFGPKGPT